MATFQNLTDAFEDDETALPDFRSTGIGDEKIPPGQDEADVGSVISSGMRPRSRLPADWRERAAEAAVEAERLKGRLTPDSEMLSRVAGRQDLVSLLTPPPVQPVPTVSASVPKTDASTSPVPAMTAPEAPKAPAAPSLGAGGEVDDEELRRLRNARLVAQTLGSFGQIASGRKSDTGVEDMLGERVKQLEALRAKKTEREETLGVERAQNNQTLDYYKRLFPDKAEDLESSLRDMTGKGQVFRQGLDAWMKREEFQKVKQPTAEARVGLMGEQEGAIGRKLGQTDARLAEIERRNKAMEAAALLAARRAASSTASDRGVKPQDLTQRLEKLNTVTKPYQEMVSSLREADTALSDLEGAAPTGLERIAGAIPGGERLLRPEALRAKRAQEGLKESYQKLKTGLAAVGQELSSFERRFGNDWFSDPRNAPLAIESLKEITREALRSAQAPYGAGTGNSEIDKLEVLSLLKNTNGLTSESSVFAPNPKLRQAAGMRPATPAAPTPEAPAPGGEKVRMIDPATKRVAKIPASEVEARKAQGWMEAP